MIILWGVFFYEGWRNDNIGNKSKQKHKWPSLKGKKKVDFLSFSSGSYGWW